MSDVQDLCHFLDASPTPDHAVLTLETALSAAGFLPIDLGAAPQPLQSGDRRYLKKGGTLIAFVVGQRSPVEAGFRIVAAHTDSPNLRIKPQPLIHGIGAVRLGVEVYGGAIVASWADRDLGIAGSVQVRSSEGRQTRLINLRRPLCRIPSLAIHLNRTVNDEGLKFNKQTQLPPLIGLGDADSDPLTPLLAEAAGCAADDLLGFDLSLYDLTAAAIGGAGDEFLFSARLDNLASTHAGLRALMAKADSVGDATAVLACFDHEEIGSRTSRGANGRTLQTLLGHVIEQTEPGEGGLERALTHSQLLSADMAHAGHPAFADKHDAQHMPRLNAGPVIKSHVNQHYTTEAHTAALFADLCAADGTPVQRFVSRSDLRCGSTVGPMIAAHLGIDALDVGNPMLSMHSAREQCGTADHPWMIQAMQRWLAGEG